MKKRLRTTAKPPMSKRWTEEQPIIETRTVQTEADKLMWDAVCRVFLRNDLSERPELRSEAYDEAHLWYAAHPTATPSELQVETSRIADRIRYQHRPDRNLTVPIEHQTDEDGSSVQINDTVALRKNIHADVDDTAKKDDRVIIPGHPDLVKVNRAPSSEPERVLNLDLPKLKQWGEELFENLWAVYSFLVEAAVTEDDRGFYWGYEWKSKAIPRTNANRTRYSRLRKKVDSMQDTLPMPVRIMVAAFRADTYRHGITNYFKMPKGAPVDLQALDDAD